MNDRDDENLRIALPKGRTQAAVFALLADAGLPVGDDGLLVLSIAFSPDHARDRRVACALGDGSVWLSQDGADTWQLLTTFSDGMVQDLAFSPDVARDGLLLLPSAEDPVWVLRADPEEGWVAESVHARRAVADGELWEAGGRQWLLALPRELQATLRPRAAMPDASARARAAPRSRAFRRVPGSRVPTPGSRAPRTPPSRLRYCPGPAR